MAGEDPRLRSGKSRLVPEEVRPQGVYSDKVVGTLQEYRGGIPYKPVLAVRSKIPSVARRADSGTIGNRSFRSPVTFDQS
jgi:hypothetical protein